MIKQNSIEVDPLDRHDIPRLEIRRVSFYSPPPPLIILGVGCFSLFLYDFLSSALENDKELGRAICTPKFFYTHPILVCE